MKLYILIGNMVIRIEKEERSVDLDRKEPRMRHYETMQQLVDWIQREERSVDLDRKEPRMRHYETINQLVDYIERKERMRHYETIKQVFGLNPREERETKNERANQRFFIDLDPIGEMFIDLDPIGEMLVYLDPIGEMVFGLNPREEMLVYLDPIGEMVFGSNPREERETKNERAIQRFLVDLDSIGEMLVDWIQREERMRHYETMQQMRHYETMQQVFGLNPREERFIDLDPIGEMFIDLDPIGEMLVYLDPIGEMMRHYETMQQVFGLNPREERASVFHFFRFIDLDPIGEMFIDLDPIGEMVFGLNPREEMLVYLDPIGEMVFGSNPREERETKNERAIQRFLVDLDSIGEMLVDWIQREERMRHYETMQQLVYLDPIGEMVFGLNPREERVFGLNPREERETKIEKAIQRFVFGLNPREERETKNEKAIQRFLVRLDSIGEMERYFSFFRETKNEGANQRFLVYLDPIGEMMEYYNIQLMKHYEAEQKLVNLNQRGEIAILNADTLGHCWGKLEVHFSNRRSWHGTKLLKSSLSLAPFFLPSAGGTGHGRGQPEHQGHSEIYPSTLNVVSNCPSRGEYMQTSLTKCAEVCGSYMQDGNCAYHCMRDSSKTKLVEFCAKPKPFFDYCPEYDPVDQTIQKDFATLCNSTSTRNYYDSSDIYFCDPNNCLQLHESSVRNGATTLTTLMNETTEMNDGDSQGWILPLFIVLAALLAVIIIGYILFRVFGKRGIFSEMRRNRNQNGKQYVYTRKRIPDYV